MASGGLGKSPLTPVSRREHYRLDTLAATRIGAGCNVFHKFVMECDKALDSDSLFPELPSCLR